MSVRPAFYLSLATYEGIKVGPIKHRQIMPTEEYGRPRPGFKGNLCGAHKSPVLASLTQNHQMYAKCMPMMKLKTNAIIVRFMVYIQVQCIYKQTLHLYINHESYNYSVCF